MTNIFKTIGKLIRRKNKKYYEASDVLTKKEKQQLFLVLTIILIPVVIGLGIYIAG